MANAAIAGINLAASGNVSASSQELQMAASNLLTPHVERRWRSKTNNDYFVFDLGSAVSLDTVAIRGVTAGASATVRVRVSSVDSTGAAGDLYDSNTASDASFDANYDAIISLLAVPVSGRYVRVDISDPAATYVEAGTVFICRRHSFTYNFAYGWQVQWVDRSTSQESRGGQTLVWRDNKYRTLQLDFKWITTIERYGVVEQVDRDNGVRDSVLIITDTASANLARDSILGIISSLTPIVQPDAVFGTDGPLFSKSYQLKERL